MMVARAYRGDVMFELRCPETVNNPPLCSPVVIANRLPS